MNHIQVVGGAGFIGSRLCKLLHKDNLSFSILDLKESSLFPELSKKADVRSVNQLANEVESSSCIINLAAEHRDDVTPLSLYDEVNVNGAENICKIAEQKGINKIVFTSSVAVYGFAPPDTDESGDIAPFNDYGRTKYEAEKIFISWQRKDPHQRMLSIIRPTVVFGEGNRGNVYNLLRQISSGRFIMIGSGNNKKSMAYVDNVAQFIKHSLNFAPGVHIYNYVDKPDLTMNKLVSFINSVVKGNHTVGFRLPYFVGLIAGSVFDLLAKLTGRKLPISTIRVKKFCATTQFSSKAKQSGFKPLVDLSEGLKRTIESEFLD
ncbi:NAD-dependent epimerase/dehydratase family protein [Agarilytica rhodophyticola]|uniref:NAD-dependent epimerase/dehydratase family protein n=1 Tax=Agarilytica rhodophyticola TaxID=1737490 RepID=UPI000B347352|nr:NAD-dependent epimerase/dehydratase family protein [Agarilytica rhodophyticola]